MVFFVLGFLSFTKRQESAAHMYRLFYSSYMSGHYRNESRYE